MRLPLSVLALCCLLFCSSTTRAQGHYAVEGGYRFAGIPNFFLDPVFEDFQPIFLHGGVVQFSFGEQSRYWGAGLMYGALGTPDGYLRPTDFEPEESYWAEYSLSFLGPYFTRNWVLELAPRVPLVLSAGLGIAGILGDLHATEVIPGCSGEIESCGHWRKVTRKPIELEYRMMPVVILGASLGYRLAERLTATFDVGVVNLPYVGAAIQYSL